MTHISDKPKEMSTEDQYLPKVSAAIAEGCDPEEFPRILHIVLIRHFGLLKRSLDDASWSASLAEIQTVLRAERHAAEKEAYERAARAVCRGCENDGELEWFQARWCHLKTANQMYMCDTKYEPCTATAIRQLANSEEQGDVLSTP